MNSFIYSHYQVIVVLLSDDTLPNQQPDTAFPSISSFTTYEDVGNAAASGGFAGYVTAEFSRELFTSDTMQFTIGDPDELANDRRSQYPNRPLRYGSHYTFFLRAYPLLSTEGPAKV